MFSAARGETQTHIAVLTTTTDPLGMLTHRAITVRNFFSRPRSTDAANTTVGMDNWQTWGRRKSQPTPGSYLSYLRLVDRRIVLDRIMVPNGTRRTAHMHMHHPSSTVPSPSPSHLPCYRYGYRCVALRCLGEASPVMWTSSPALSNTGGGGKGLACLIFTHLPAPHPWNICNSF